MSDIKAGDLVQVVRWKCCNGAIGQVFTVSSFIYANIGDCQFCGTKHRFGDDHIPFARSESNHLVRGATVVTQWLKRIPPLEELENEKNKEGLHA
jgi:hypothetical protein